MNKNTNFQQRDNTVIGQPALNHLGQPTNSFLQEQRRGTLAEQIDEKEMLQQLGQSFSIDLANQSISEAGIENMPIHDNSLSFAGMFSVNESKIMPKLEQESRIIKMDDEIPLLQFANEKKPTKKKEVEQPQEESKVPEPARPQEVPHIQGKVEAKEENLDQSNMGQISTLNKMSVNLPILQFLNINQEQKQEIQRHRAIVALKLDQMSEKYNEKAKQKEGEPFFKIENGELVDELRTHQTERADDPAWKINLFEEQHEQKEEIKANIIEDMYDRLGLQSIIEESCTYGKNLTLFSLETGNKYTNISKMFNGNLKAKNNEAQVIQLDSISKPGMIRIVIEAIFAHIFLQKKSEYAIGISYVEINSEQIYDLLNKGEQVENQSQVTVQKVNSIDSILQSKQQGEAFRLSNILKTDSKEIIQSSTLVLKCFVENTAINSNPDDPIINISEISFVQLPDVTKTKQSADRGFKAIEHIMRKSIKNRTQKDPDILKIDDTPVCQSTLTYYLKVQLEGNSRFAYLISIPQNGNYVQVMQAIEIARDAAQVEQRYVGQNYIDKDKSLLFCIKKEIESKENQLKVIEFQRGAQKQQKQQMGQQKDKISFINRPSMENIDKNQKKLQRFRIKNELKKLNLFILTQKGVANIIKQFIVNEDAKKSNAEMLPKVNPREKVSSGSAALMAKRDERKTIMSKQYLRQSIANERMLKMLGSSENFTEVKERSDQIHNDKMIRSSVAKFLNDSIRDIKQDNRGSIAGMLRNSIANQLRSSVVLKQSIINKKKEGQQDVLQERKSKLDMGMDAQSGFNFGAKGQAGTSTRMSDVMKNRPSQKYQRRSQVIMEQDDYDEEQDDQEENKYEDKGGHEEGDLSMFQEQLSMVIPEIKPRGQPTIEQKLDQLFAKEKPVNKKNELKNLRMTRLDNLAGLDQDIEDMDDLELLENFENLEIDGIKIEGDQLNIDINIVVDLPDYLDGIDLDASIQEIMQKTSEQPFKFQPRISSEPKNLQSKRTAPSKSTLTTLKNPIQIPSISEAEQQAKPGFGGGLQQSIQNLSSYIASTVQSASSTLVKRNKDKIEKKEKLEKSVAFVEQSDSSSQEEGKEEMKYEESSDSSDGLQGKDSDEQSNMFDNVFDISQRNDTESESELNLSVASILARAHKNKEKRVTRDGPTSRRQANSRATVIPEAESDDEDDSFDIKREMKKKQKLQKYETKLSDIQKEVEQYTTVSNQKIKQSMDQMNQLTQRATMLKEKRKLDTQVKNGEIKNMSSKVNIPNMDMSEDMNFFDLQNIDEDDLLDQIGFLESETKKTMLDIMSNQKKFEQNSQKEMTKTIKAIKNQIKEGIANSEQSINRRTELRATMKQLQNQSSSNVGAPGKPGECAECPKLRFQIADQTGEIAELKEQLKAAKGEVELLKQMMID